MAECTLCSSRDITYLWPVRDHTEYHIHECRSCLVRFIDPQPADEFLRTLYSKSYYDARGYAADTDTFRLMKFSTFNRRLKLIKQFVTKGKVLDVGCATGFFLEAAKSAGFTPYGVEFSHYSAQIAKQKFGDDAVFEGILEKCPFPERSFDVIAMSDLLEHVRNPRTVLAKAHTLLKEDGIVMIMTPDTGSLTNRIMQEKWAHYNIEHLYYFNRNSLGSVAEMHGFRVVHCEPAKKTLSLSYFYNQFTVYRHWLLSPVLALIHAILPQRLLDAHFAVTVGEMVAILKKQPLRTE